MENKIENKCTENKAKVVKNSYGIYFCGNCKGSVWQRKDESNYCFRCGKEIDWAN